MRSFSGTNKKRMNNQQVNMNSQGMSRQEKQAAFSLALIYAFRMMGLFMILPVFALYADDLTFSTPLLLGLALGIYGLTQAALQIPFGLVSDRYGRKPVILFGLLLFAAGSLVAASADSIYVVIAGRALQGAGAIASVVMALAADLSREEQRTKVMAIIGVSIGASFMLSIVLGPLLSNYIGVPGIFVLTAIFAVLGMLMVAFVVPNPPPVHENSYNLESALISLYLVTRDKRLMTLNMGIFLLHLIITAGFIALPFLLRDTYQISIDQHWWVYFWVLLGSILLVLPCIMLSDRRQLTEPMMLGAVMVLSVALLILALFSPTSWVFLGVLVVFFAAFNLLEASLPAQVSKTVNPSRKGVALGLYSSCQFLGAFLGGITGGWLLGLWGPSSILLLGAIVASIWLVLAGSLAWATNRA